MPIRGDRSLQLGLVGNSPTTPNACITGKGLWKALSRVSWPSAKLATIAKLKPNRTPADSTPYIGARSWVASKRSSATASPPSMIFRTGTIFPSDEASNQLAACYVSLGRETDALEAYRRVVAAAEKQLELHPEDGRALYMGAAALSALGETERGLRWAERALVLEPEEPATLYNIACFYVLKGNTDSAIDCLDILH